MQLMMKRTATVLAVAMAPKTIDRPNGAAVLARPPRRPLRQHRQRPLPLPAVALAAAAAGARAEAAAEAVLQQRQQVKTPLRRLLLLLPPLPLGLVAADGAVAEAEAEVLLEGAATAYRTTTTMIHMTATATAPLLPQPPQQPEWAWTRAATWMCLDEHETLLLPLLPLLLPLLHRQRPRILVWTTMRHRQRCCLGPRRAGAAVQAQLQPQMLSMALPLLLLLHL
jgi:hypothetical protein